LVPDRLLDLRLTSLAQRLCRLGQPRPHVRTSGSPISAKKAVLILQAVSFVLQLHRTTSLSMFANDNRSGRPVSIPTTQKIPCRTCGLFSSLQRSLVLPSFLPFAFLPFAVPRLLRHTRVLEIHAEGHRPLESLRDNVEGLPLFRLESQQQLGHMNHR